MGRRNRADIVRGAHHQRKPTPGFLWGTVLPSSPTVEAVGGFLQIPDPSNSATVTQWLRMVGRS